jgi:lysophospholipase L1-like esterase
MLLAAVMPTSLMARGAARLMSLLALACAAAVACSSKGSNDGGGFAGAPDGATADATADRSSTPADASSDQASPPSKDASGADSRPSVLEIMALGDSITRATCWRAQLWQQLNESFASRFHLVGTLSSDFDCGVAGYETANQGYSGALVTQIMDGITDARACDPFCPTLSDLTTAFDAIKPDVLLMHFGTNDVWSAVPPGDILNAYSAVIDALRGANPNVTILVAQIIPMDVTSATCSGCSCPSCVTAVPALNAQIAAWAPTKSTAASPIIVVDQYTGFDADADTRDGVHPNDTGSSKMAAKWYASLAPLF